MTHPDTDPIPVDPDLGPSRGRRRDRRGRVDVLASIACGGVIGASARYGLARAIPTHADGFPTATFVANVVGSFLLGLVVVLSVERLAPRRYLRPFVAIGALGSFTTFSTFAVENVRLVDDGAIAVAVVYVVATLAAGLAAAWVGITAARLIPRFQRGASS